MENYKFRAWYTGDSPHMIYDVEKTYDYRCRGVGCDEDCFGDILSNDSYIVMQYTRLKDSEGKLIYDSDICLVNNHPCLVVFSDGLYKLYYKYDEYALYLWADSCTVIGNKYENPELMKEIKLWMK